MNKIITITGLLIILTFASCTKLQDYNENPNNVKEVHPQLLLTNIVWDAFQVEGANPMYATHMIVQTDREDIIQYYKWNRGDFNYYNDLRNVTKMIEEAERIQDPSYIAIGKLFRAYYFYKLTLQFGDIPYSQALKGESEGIYTPVYDSQKDIFIGILKELEEANQLISDNPIAGDIVYRGNPDNWKKLINSFRLKVLITLSKKENDNDLNIKNTFANIVASQPIFTSISDNAQIAFLDQLGSRYTEFNNSNYGSGRYADSTMIKRLRDRQDPRLFIYYGQTREAKESGLPIDDFNGYDGGNPIASPDYNNRKAVAGLSSRVNLRYTTNPVTEPHNLLSYSELQFILAEAVVRGWISGDAKTYYDNGIKASFKFYHDNAPEYASYVDDNAAATYLTNPLVDFSTASSNEEKIEKIITQKFLTTFLQGGWLGFFEHLRTGYPHLDHLPNFAPPYRWMYPETEYRLNAENVTAAISSQFGVGNDNIREKTWWLK